MDLLKGMNLNLGQIVWICMDEWSRTSHRGSRFAWDMFHVLFLVWCLWANFDIFGRYHCAKELGCTCFIISTSVQHKIKLLENLSVELALLKLFRFWMLFVGNCRDGITQNRFELLTECSHLFALQDRSFKVTQILDVVSYQLWDKR